MDNESSDKGGVLYGSDKAIFIVENGTFKKNKAGDGAVAAFDDGGDLQISGGEYIMNEAESAGGAFYVSDGGGIKVGTPV